MKRIGERIKRRRELLHLQLNDLARKVGISSSALSQIEKAKAFPSIITLKSIADHLHSSVGDLIGENETLSKNPVLRKEEIKFVEKNETGAEVYLLSHHDMNKNMDTYMIRFFEGSDLNGLFTSVIGQIFCHVVSGQIRFSLDDKNYVLGKGDNMYFNSKIPYSVHNDYEETSELLWILSPPNF